jgi:hypothetical protein
MEWVSNAKNGRKMPIVGERMNIYALFGTYIFVILLTTLIILIVLDWIREELKKKRAMDKKPEDMTDKEIDELNKKNELIHW